MTNIFEVRLTTDFYILVTLQFDCNSFSGIRNQALGCKVMVRKTMELS